ncbi:MAG: PIN domain-containing protein [Candidatus Woesearchaeota archaeon]
MAIFVDSSVLCAFANKDDIHHARSKEIMKDVAEGKYGQPIITDYIFDETMSVIMRKKDHETATGFGTHLLNSQLAMSIMDGALFVKSWSIFQKEALSFTDCSIVAFMQVFKVNKLATFDKGFKQFNWIKIVD